MERTELDEILHLHQLWLKGEADGTRANLQRAILQRANLQEANLREVDLRGADLLGANLQRADLRGADLDYSSWPLWCGTRGVEVDLRLVYQLLAHVAALNCNDETFKVIRTAILPWAKQSHRAIDLGLIDKTGE